MPDSRPDGPPRIRFQLARPEGEAADPSREADTAYEARRAAAPPDELIISHERVERGEIQFEIPEAALTDMLLDQQEAFTRVYRALDDIGRDLKEFFPRVAEPLPPRIEGILLNPDGSPAANVAVELPLPEYSEEERKADPGLASMQWGTPRDVTDARGSFALALPPGTIPRAGLAVQVRGHEALANLRVRGPDLRGVRLGNLILSRPVRPLPNSVLAQLRRIQDNILAGSEEDVLENPGAFATPGPQIMLGEGDCARFFRSGSGVIDRFRYSVMIRLVEPRLNRLRPAFRVPVGTGRSSAYRPLPIPDASDSFWRTSGIAAGIARLEGLGRLFLVNRTPISRPIDVTDFHRSVERNPASVPKASTLGLGYIVNMRQTWVPAGLSLGDLVYSLPLAPGEQQRIAIQETRQSASEREQEAMSEDERQTFTETEDSSALAAFQSAFREAAAGGSRMSSESETTSVAATASTGFFGAIFGGGGVSTGHSTASSSGSSSSWQNASRDFASSSSQEMHSALTRVAAASRRSTRTRIRVASAMERTEVTTRVVTNNNRNHALTMQWWQVLRHYQVTSEVDDVQLVCYVPFELIPFLPAGQPPTLTFTPSRSVLLARYELIHRYHDVLAPFFRRNREYAHGLRQLREFVSNPQMVPDTSPVEQESVEVTLTGSFMPFEEVFVTAVGRSGARMGPLLMGPQTTSGVNLAPNAFPSRAAFLGHLRSRRVLGSSSRSVAFSLPRGMGRNDIVRLDVTRRFTSVDVRLAPPAPDLSNLPGFLQAMSELDLSLSSSELEAELAGPRLTSATATLTPAGPDLLGTTGNLGGRTMGGLLPLPTLRIAPVLSQADLLRIEGMFQHVVRNTVTYSRAVWASLTAEERAILLERFTIGVPAGGVPGPDQEVPLLNCVANRVLGFFGNAAIMPFSIPAPVAESMGVTSRDIQDALLRFHRQSFQPPRSSITLPARGTLGEAILGSCNSAEKIDLTRFWNWQDSPIPQADPIPPSSLQPAQALAAFAGARGAGGGQGGPASGAGASGSVITINSPGAGGASRTALAEALVAGSPDLARELNLSGLEVLQKQMAADSASAAAGRKEAIDSVTQIQLQAMKSAEGVVKAVAEAAGEVAGGAVGGAAGALITGGLG
jgi:hypothetical protein